MTLQIIRDRVMRFNARGPSGLINGKAPGNQGKLSDVHRQALAKVVESGPIPAVHGVVRWRRKDLVQWLFQEYRISVDETTIGRELKALGFAKLSARPRHYAQNEGDLESFRKTSLPHWQPSKAGSQRTSRSSSGGPNEARIGHKNKITRRWARKGTRPSAPLDQRTMWTYIFGAICPKKGKAAGLFFPTATPTP